jgi:hypothetical protein
MKANLLAMITALAGVSCTAPPELSTAEQYNRQLAARAPVASAPEKPPSESFARHFRRVFGSVVAVPGDDTPTRCLLAPDGSVYLAARGRGALYAWAPGEATARRLPATGDASPKLPTALAWSHQEELLYVLDQGTNRVLKYRPDGTLSGDVPLNAGQSGFALDVLDDGSLLVGGERWESGERITLLARYGADGRFRGSSFPMDTLVVRGRMHLHTPVLLARDGATAYLAEPTSYTWARVAPDGRDLGRHGVPPAGYRAPSPLPGEVPDVAEMEAWRGSWTPQLFLHAGGSLVFSAFEVRRPYHGFAVDVYGPDGTRRSTGLLSEGRPTCGLGTRLVFLRDAGEGCVELRAYDYVENGAPAPPTRGTSLQGS